MSRESSHRAVSEDPARDGARIAHRPAARLDLVKKVLTEKIEERRLLEIYRMTGTRQHHQRRRLNIPFHQEPRFEASFVLIARHDYRRHRETLHLVDQII